MQKAVEHLDNLRETKINKDDAATYAESWAVSYRKLDETQKLYAKKAIDEILIMGQLKQLTLDTVSSSSSRVSTPALIAFPSSSNSRSSTPGSTSLKEKYITFIYQNL